MRIILSLTLVMCSLGMSAQTERDSIAADSTLWDKDPFYLQFYIGVNKSANENLPWTEFSRYPWSTGMFIALGREVNRLWGWRATLRINRNKSRNVPVCESKDVWGWSNTGLFADATFDVSDVFRRSKPTTRASRFNMKAFAGVGLAFTWNFDKVPLSYTHAYSRSSKVLPGLRVGLTATWRLTDRWRLGAELSQSLFEDHFNGVAYGAPLDTRTNLKVGVNYYFRKKKKPVPPPVVRLHKLKECPLLPLVMPDPEETKLRQIEGRAFLDFPVNETVIYPTYRNNPKELARIQKSVDSAMFDKSVIITRITLHGYASPESPYSNNTRLAKGRTEALKNYLVRNYNFKPQVFQTNYTPEDWDNLQGFLINTEGRRTKGDFWYDSREYVETPQVPDYVLEHRDEMLRIINRNMDPDAKNELLKTVGDGEPYRWLLENVYPGLRHTDYTIEYKIRPFSVDKGRKLIYTHPEGLSMEEMFLVAESYREGSEGWTDALLIAARMYPEDETANLNAACACVKTKRMNDARIYLEKAGQTPEAHYLNNVILAMEGQVDWKLEDDVLIIPEEEKNTLILMPKRAVR